MSVRAPSRPDQTATTVPQALEGAAVYDADGRRVGLVEATDPGAGRFTLVQAGFALGALGGTMDVPLDLIRQADSERVDLLVPASALEEHS